MYITVLKLKLKQAHYSFKLKLEQEHYSFKIETRTSTLQIEN